MADILQIAADLRTKHMPPMVRPFTGSPTPTERATEGQGPPAWLAKAGTAPAKSGETIAPAQMWRTSPQVGAQPIPMDKTYLRAIDAHGGRIVIEAQPGTRALRYARANFAAELANGVGGVHVRLVQSQGKVRKGDVGGPVLLASSDPKDAERLYVPDAKRDPNGVLTSLRATVDAAKTPVLGGKVA